MGRPAKQGKARALTAQQTDELTWRGVDEHCEHDCPVEAEEVEVGTTTFEVCSRGFFADGEPCLSAFASPASKVAGWFDNRDMLMARSRPGSRPEGWWEFEAEDTCRHEPRCELPAPIECEPTCAEHRAEVDDPIEEQARARAAWLVDHDLLTARERRALAAEERSRTPRRVKTQGVSGNPAKRAHSGDGALDDD